MKEQTVRRIVLTAALVGIAIDVAAFVLLGCKVKGWSGSVVMVSATAVMIATLVLQVGFVIVQLLPNGRAMVPIRFLGPDGWYFVIISTILPGGLWPFLAAQAAPPMHLIMPGFFTPAVMGLLLMFGRMAQQRQQRQLRAPTT